MDIFLFVVGYVIQLIASGILLYRVLTVKSIHGLSMDTQFSYLFATIARCVWTLNTRIVDTHALITVMAATELVASTISTGFIVFMFHRLRHTASESEGSILLTWKFLTPLCLVGACIVNPGAWFRVSLQILVGFTMYIEAVALIPQLSLLRKMSDVEALTSHYIGLLVIARFVRVCFWIVLYVGGDTFLCLLFADMFHTVLCADYMYLWVRKLRHGGRLVYTL